MQATHDLIYLEGKRARVIESEFEIVKRSRTPGLVFHRGLTTLGQLEI